MNSWFIDDITWNDLSMEQVYERINTAQSSVGEECLKKILRTTLTEPEKLADRSERAGYFSGHPQIRKQYSDVFRNLGKTKKLSLYEYIFRFHEVKSSGNGIHYLLILLLLAAVALIFVRPVIGIIAVVVMFAVNIGSYFRYKARVESYFMCFKYIVRMVQTASRIGKLKDAQDGEGLRAMTELKSRLEEASRELAPVKRGSFLITNSVSGSLVDVVMDYVRMLFHVDIIHFNRVRKLAEDKADQIDELYQTLGEMETAICISSFRDSLDTWCRPRLNGEMSLHIRGMYHPLTRDPVPNDLDTSRSVLLTGSNASGKSTFLKQLAINQIFAQTIDTCLAQEYQSGFFRVLSSMALSDNILGEESYFIVEIKSLKRILDAVSEDPAEMPVMCFIDEVLRGTNTRERIAASSQILKWLSCRRTLCFAATHDIELTVLLKEWMENYHFEERVDGDDVIFDYKIRKGAATTRNAIRLMEAYGFDPEITREAFELASRT